MDSLTAGLFVLGLILLIGGAELLVRGASALALRFGLSPLVIGLTVVAYGTSSPELAISLGASLSGETDLAAGNVVGSNIFNILLILGLSASIAPLIVSRRLVRLEVPIMILISFALLLLVRDGELSRLEGAALFAGALAYSTFVIRQSRRESANSVDDAPPSTAGAARSAGWQTSLPAQLALILLGLGFLVIGSRWLVDGAVEAARALGVSELVIGLTVLAAGTSLPEVATSVLAVLRGERDIAVGNIVGSNIANILVILGLTGALSPNAIPVAPGLLNFDIPVMIAVAVACLPIFFTGQLIGRWEGVLFLGYYLAYTAYLILDATGHDALGAYSAVMLTFVVPLTALTLVTLGVWAVLDALRVRCLP